MGDKSAAVIRSSILDSHYGFRVHLSISDDPRNQASKVGVEGRETDAAFSSLIWPNAYIFFEHGYIDHGIIYHEVDHVVHDTLRYIGVRESEDSAETYTYLGQWITTWVYGQMNKYKISVEI